MQQKSLMKQRCLFPQSDYAPKAALMAAYSYYSQNYYGDAIAELERFTKIYPNHYNIDYAEYLLGLCFYEQIVDEKKDLKSMVLMLKKCFFKCYRINIHETDFAIDAKFKLDLIEDVFGCKRNVS